MAKKTIPQDKKNISLNEEDLNNASKLFTANEQLALQVIEREKRATELVIANKELALQVIEKEKRAAELVIANIELAYQNQEKENRAAELVIANKELAYQNKEKENRAAELVIANKELAFQVIEKEKRAAELVIANVELAYQNKEKEDRAAELVIANKELALQVIEKEKRAAELVIANKELAFQNKEKEKRAAELLIVNKELESFTFISSHDLQEPLRKIQTFSSRILDSEYDNLSEKGKYYVDRTNLSAKHMQSLINDLLAYSRANLTEKKYENIDLNLIIEQAMDVLKDEIKEKDAIVEIQASSCFNMIPFQIRQVFQNLIANSIKFCDPAVKPRIKIKSNFIKYDASKSENFVLKSDHYHISILDNGIGFDPQFKERIFEVFQRLHQKNTYDGTGMGLTIVKKIVENHNGIIRAESKENEGATFNIYIPANQS